MMKKIFLAAGILLSSVTITFAHDGIERKHRKEAKKDIRKERRVDNRNQVNDLTKTKFERDFPEATNVYFVKTKYFDEVSFNSGSKHNKKMTAYYDINNDLVGTTQEKTFADLPEKAQEEIDKKYVGYNKEAVIKFIDNGENESVMNLYDTALDDTDAYFVALKNGSKSIVVKVDLVGYVTFFKDLNEK